MEIFLVIAGFFVGYLVGATRGELRAQQQQKRGDDWFARYQELIKKD